MADFSKDKNNIIFNKALNKLQLRFPVATIEKATKENKGNISNFRNNKKPVSDNFLETFSEAFKIDLKEFGYTKGLTRILETENPPPTKDEGFIPNNFNKIINTYIDLLERANNLNDRLQKDLDFERSKNNKI